jgi:hypothetical protein
MATTNIAKINFIKSIPLYDIPVSLDNELFVLHAYLVIALNLLRLVFFGIILQFGYLWYLALFQQGKISLDVYE